MSTTSGKSDGHKHYEIIEYGRKVPFRITNIMKDDILDRLGKAKNVLEHWHPELEITYTISGNAVHYIDGERYNAEPGSVLITNSNSIHKVLSDINSQYEDDKIAIVLNINYDFVRKLIPNIDKMYFETCPKDNLIEISAIMKELSQYDSDNLDFEPYTELHLTGLVYQLMYYLCRQSIRLKEQIMPVNYQKNLARLQEIMQYVRDNYTEPVLVKDVAEQFYFTKEYFSRFFKKNTGLTFKEYLTRYRINAATEELLYTNETILQISYNCGFTDVRGFINSFKDIYGVTPLSYRKAKRHELEVNI